MATLSYTQETMPKSSEEFQRQLAEAIANSNPIDDLLELAAELRGFEKQYEMASDEFYRCFKAGQLGDDLDFFDWSSSYRMYSNLRRSIESALMRSAVWPSMDLTVITNVPLEKPVSVPVVEAVAV